MEMQPRPRPKRAEPSQMQAARRASKEALGQQANLAAEAQGCDSLSNQHNRFTIPHCLQLTQRQTVALSYVSLDPSCSLAVTSANRLVLLGPLQLGHPWRLAYIP